MVKILDNTRMITINENGFGHGFVYVRMYVLWSLYVSHCVYSTSHTHTHTGSHIQIHDDFRRAIDDDDDATRILICTNDINQQQSCACSLPNKQNRQHFV